MRLIDADELGKMWEKMLPIMVPDEDGKHPVSLEKAIEKLKDAPTVDAVPVVRCKNCGAYQTMDVSFPRCRITGRMKGIDDYCSSGERKEGE